MAVIRSSTFNRVLPGRVAGPPPVVLWPRWVGGRLQMLPISAEAIPPGWQSVRVRLPMRIGTCEESRCDFLENGWSEVVIGDVSEAYAGRLDPEEAGQIFGFGGQGAARIPPTVVHREPGTPCPRIHKIPAGLPPVYFVNGRTVLWNEFEDSLLGGWQRAGQMS